MEEVSVQTLPFFCFNVSIGKGYPARHALSAPTKQRFTMSLVEAQPPGFLMMMIACITINSGLEPLIEGLCAAYFPEIWGPVQEIEGAGC